MRKLILPVVLIASLAAGSTAFAAANTTTGGVVKALDAKAHTVTLDNKDVYHFAKTIDLSKITVGENVAITWHLYKKMDVGTKIVAAAPTTMTPKKS